MKNPVFSGAAVAIVTPYTKDGIDFDKLGKLIDFQIENGTDAIVINGTTGESSTQTIPEHLAVIEFGIRRVAGRVPVIAGTGSNDTADAIVMSVEAEKAGADALLIVTPYYNKTSQRGLIAHFNAIADKVSIPIILYNVPSRTGLSFTAETYAALSAHPNINGVKEASGNFALIAKTRYLCPKDFHIWSGNDDQVIPVMSLGGLGVISVASNVIPAEMAKMSKLFLEGKTKEACDMQIHYLDLIDKLFIDVNPIPVKAALNMMGFDVGHLRMPLVELSDVHKAQLAESMKAVGLKLAE